MQRAPRGDKPNSPFRIAALAMGVVALLVVAWFIVIAVIETFTP
ncbi:hypothetical protein [Enemella evansiae]|nr:hypothetical protein [Enemella evansiae]TDO84755.1 hypothetical protein C8D81_4108 [Enemella evansiae]